MASLLTTFLENPNVSNLVELYDPVKIVDRALRHPHTILDGRKGIRHDALAPDFDLRETSNAYYLEGEFPGISSKENFKLQWLDGRTLRVQGRARKTDLKQVWGKGDVDMDAEEPKDDTNGFVVDEKSTVAIGDSTKNGEKGVHQWLNERREGLMVRTFNFASAVDIDRIQAKLSQGVLLIKVPKVNSSEMGLKDIAVEFQN